MRGRPSLGKSSKQRISITIDPDLIEILKVKAEEDDRSLSQYINRVLRKMLMATTKTTANNLNNTEKPQL